MDERDRRMARNEALFREVNERVNDVVSRRGSGTDYDYLCECANADRTFRLTLTRADYEAVRADPTQFVVLPQHFMPEVETVVATGDAYWLVRKTGEAEYVQGLDPRARRGPGSAVQAAEGNEAP